MPYSLKGGGRACFVVDVGDYMPGFRGFVIDPEGPVFEREVKQVYVTSDNQI